MSDKWVLVVIICILCLVIAALCVRFWQYRKQVECFAKRIRARNEVGMNQPVTVDLFQKEFIELANALNDYTEQQKELTVQLEQERGLLKQIVAGISHDFRTPLTAAIGYMQLIDKNGNLDTKSQEHLEIAMKKMDFLKELSDSFFELASMEGKGQEIEIKSLSIGKLLQESILKQFDWIQEKGLQTEFEIPERDIFVEGNEHYIRRIFDNLFSNVSKYAQTFLRIGLQEKENQVIFWMENDTNSEEIDCQKVFEPFYRVASRNKQGSGLGLYVVKNLAGKMGVSVQASVEGNCFRMQMVFTKK